MLRNQAALIAGAMSLVLAASAVLRASPRRSQLLFAVFAVNVSAWYFTDFFSDVSFIWARLHLASGITLPLAAVQFFRVFLHADDAPTRVLHRTALGSGVAILALLVTPLADGMVIRIAIFSYMAVFLIASMAMLVARAAESRSDVTRKRLRYLAFIGGLASVFTLLEYLPLFGVQIPPWGAALLVLFLYALSLSVEHARLLDLSEVVGRVAIMTFFALALAGALLLLTRFTGGALLPAVVASFLTFILFDPIRDRVRETLTTWFVRERAVLDASVHDAREHFSGAMQPDEIIEALVSALERSKRITVAGVYLVDPQSPGFVRVGAIGERAPERVEELPRLIELLARGPVELEAIQIAIDEHRERGETARAAQLDRLAVVVDGLAADICLPIESGGEVRGFVTARDDRAKWFSDDEVDLLARLVEHASVALDRAAAYRDLKERDRLAALGEMAAGLAHEIRNPLGAIKASAQYLTDPEHVEETPAEERHEFLDIIVGEVDRLNHVVASFLDFARPSDGERKAPIDATPVLERAMTLVGREHPDVTISLELNASRRIAILPERLTQIALNLARNAVQAMDGEGHLTVSASDLDSAAAEEVVITFRDRGPGIPDEIRDTLFGPFVTTKHDGTGLGLAITHQLVTAVGGKIEVESAPGGATFAMTFPAESPDDE